MMRNGAVAVARWSACQSKPPTTPVVTCPKPFLDGLDTSLLGRFPFQMWDRFSSISPRCCGSRAPFNATQLLFKSTTLGRAGGLGPEHRYEEATAQGVDPRITGAVTRPMAVSNVATQLKTIDDIQGRIESIHTDVLQARLIVTCLQRSIGRNRNLTDSEYDAILSSISDPDITQFVKNFTTIADFTKEKAKDELEKAENKLKEAKDELKEAKDELKVWEAKYSEEEILTIVTNTSHQKDFEPLKEEEGKGVHRVEMINEFSSELDKKAPPPISKQKSFAMVLAGSSGVGKTYSSFYIGSGVLDTPGKRKVVSAYCGVNNGWALNQSEGDQIRKYGFEGMRIVVYTRVALALQHRAANMNHPWHCLNYNVRKSMTIDDATVIIKDALTKIRDQCQKNDPSCKVFVFGVVDEVQSFSLYAQPDPPKGEALAHNDITSLGAPRRALDILREIQAAVYSVGCGVMFVGLTTGTIYEASIIDPSFGVNIFLSKPLCSLEDFMGLKPSMDTDWRYLTPYQTNCMKKVAYPRARLLELNISEWAFYVNVDKCVAQRLFPAVLSQESLAIKELSGHVTFLGPLTGVDKCKVLDDYLLMLACVSELTPYLPSQPAAYIENHETFEKQVGEVLMCIVALGSSNLSGKAVRGAVVKQNPWLREIFGTATAEAIPILGEYQRHKLDNSKTNYMPFVGAASLISAIATGVHPDVKRFVDEMPSDSCLLLHCGGSAPFDFILFVKVGAVGAPLRIAMFDAKHSEDGDTKEDTKAKEMAKKYKLVCAGLKKEFPDAEFAPLFIVTNRTVPSDTCGITYLTRGTMKLGGLTRVLFDHMVEVPDCSPPSPT